jgi:hypothetical protein
MGTLRERVVRNLALRRKRILDGQLNCIPSPFERFSDDFIGIEQACYYTVTSFTKGGKSQFTSFTFIYKPLMFCYHTQSDVSVKILYFPLEETPERILQRFISWLLYDYSNGEIRISPRDLRSTKTAVPQKILDIINTPEIQDIIKYFEEHVIFPEEQPNPTGIYKYCKRYAEEHGTVYTKPGKYKDELGIVHENQVFDRYEQDNPNEYRIVIIDTINLVDSEKGMTLKQSMDKLSEYLAKYLRNRYNYSPVVIQQQAFEQEGNEAFKLGRVRPSVAGLGDSKYTSRDSNVVLGLFSPFRFSLREYEGYDISKFKDNIRFLEMIVNRDGEMGGLCPLFFDGAVCQFNELPRPDDKEGIKRVLAYIEAVIRKKPSISLFMYNIDSSVKNIKKRLHKKNIFSIFAKSKQ